MCIRDSPRILLFDDALSAVDTATEEAILRELRAVMKGRTCLLYTSDAADERSSVDLGGRRIIKKQNQLHQQRPTSHY